jgi:hypothetical protein
LAGWDGTKVRDPIVVDAVVGDKSRDAFLEGGSAGCEIPAEAYTHEGDLLRIDAGKREGEINDWSENVLPIGPEGQTLTMDRAILARTVEGKDVIAALDTGACPFAMQFFGGTVKAGVHDKKRSRCVGFIHPMEVARESGVSVRNLDRKDGRIVKRTASFIGLNRLLISTVNAQVFWIAVEEKL